MVDAQAGIGHADLFSDICSAILRRDVIAVCFDKVQPVISDSCRICSNAKAVMYISAVCQRFSVALQAELIGVISASTNHLDLARIAFLYQRQPVVIDLEVFYPIGCISRQTVVACFRIPMECPVCNRVGNIARRIQLVVMVIFICHHGQDFRKQASGILRIFFSHHGFTCSTTIPEHDTIGIPVEMVGITCYRGIQDRNLAVFRIFIIRVESDTFSPIGILQPFVHIFHLKIEALIFRG